LTKARQRRTVTLATGSDRREFIARESTDGSTGSRARRQRSLAVLLLPLHLFLLAGWARAAAEKVIDPQWWSSEHLRRFLDEQRPHMLPWFGWLSDHLLTPLAPQVAITVVGMQIGIVICLATNHRVKQALVAGIVLNLCFTMAGRVNPSAFYLVMQVAMLFALSRPAPREVALRRAGVWASLAAGMAPFARTLHPREVIDDPALMLAFLATVAAVTTVARSLPVEDMVKWVEQTGPGRTVVNVLRTRLGIDSSRNLDLKQEERHADNQPNGPVAPESS
jgi:hypothetical protein